MHACMLLPTGPQGCCRLAMGSANRALKRSREAMEGALVGDCSKLHKALATGIK